MEANNKSQYKWSIIIVFFALTVLLSDVGLWMWGKQQISHIADDVRSDSELVKAEFKSEIERGIKESIGSVTKKLSAASDELIKESLSSYKNQLADIRKKITNETEKLNKTKERRIREAKGLPELVELDDLRNYYANKFKTDDINQTKYQTFDTSKGRISFIKSDLSWEIVPSTNELAWIRIGKKSSTLNSELIIAWINDSRALKKKMGYKQIYKRKKPTDYGEYTETLLEKGEMYFKTYYQYIRVQGTYNSTSYQYIFYVETGSKSRREKAKTERYNRALGS